MLKSKLITRIFFIHLPFLIFPVALFLPQCKKQAVYIHRSKPEITISAGNGLLSAPVIHFSADTVYVLAVSLTRDSGEKLEIEPGTIIKVNDRVSVTVNRGAIMEANGSAGLPIVFTSSASKGGVGAGSGAAGGEHYWYGIRIYGNDATTGASSGSISYLRIEFAGGNEGSLGLEDALPAFLLREVSSATTLHDIEVSYSFEVPSFEFSGGTVNAKQLVSYAGVGIDFYLRRGYTGKMQKLLAYRHPYFAETSGLKGTLCGLLLDDSLTFPVISNLTILGPGPQRSTSPIYALESGDFNSYRIANVVSTSGVRFNISNSVILGFPHASWYLDDQNTAVSLSSGTSKITHSYFQCDDTVHPFYLDPTVFPPFNSNDFRNIVLQPANQNRFVAGFDYSGLSGALDYDTHPDPVPAAGSALLNGAVFEDAFSGTFFDKVAYVGAVGADDWVKGWANFIPLQTGYNR